MRPDPGSSTSQSEPARMLAMALTGILAAPACIRLDVGILAAPMAPASTSGTFAAARYLVSSCRP